jgi:hypothetical protein
MIALNLNEREIGVLDQLAKQKDMSRDAVMRRALRIYQIADKYLMDGWELAFHQKAGQTETLIFPLRSTPKMAPMGGVDGKDMENEGGPALGDME